MSEVRPVVGKQEICEKCGKIFSFCGYLHNPKICNKCKLKDEDKGYDPYGYSS
jgi:hypothetical protein